MGNNHKTNNKYQGKMKFTTKTLALLMAAAVTVSCSGDGSRKNQIVPLDIDSNMTEAEIRAGILTPEVMWKMGRVGESVLSPDGKSVVYSVTWYNMQENRGLSHLYLMPSEAASPNSSPSMRSMTTRPSGVPTARPSTFSATVPAKVRYGPSVPTARGYIRYPI